MGEFTNVTQSADFKIWSKSYGESHVLGSWAYIYQNGQKIGVLMWTEDSNSNDYVISTGKWVQNIATNYNNHTTYGGIGIDYSDVANVREIYKNTEIPK